MGEWKQTDISRITMRHSEYMENGCPKCGELCGYSMVSGRGATIWQCSGCRFVYTILNDNIKQTPFDISKGQVAFAL